VGKRRGAFREASVTAVVPDPDLGAVDTADGAAVLREPVTAM
jgi:hypothetical protein